MSTRKSASAVAADRMHAFGIVGGVAFGMDRRALVRAAKALADLGLVRTGGAHSGHNRSAYFWDLTPIGSDLLTEMVRAGFYPLADWTSQGRSILQKLKEAS